MQPLCLTKTGQLSAAGADAAASDAGRQLISPRPCACIRCCWVGSAGWQDAMPHAAQSRPPSILEAMGTAGLLTWSGTHATSGSCEMSPKSG